MMHSCHTLFLAASQGLELLRTHEPFDLLLRLRAQLPNLLPPLLWGERAIAADRLHLTVGTLLDLADLRHHRS